jgi:phage repressor protein C with HTH and peptisase S24 domain
MEPFIKTTLVLISVRFYNHSYLLARSWLFDRVTPWLYFPMMNMTLSERLKIAMREAGYTQAALAERAGMTQAGVQKLTSGKARSSTKIIDIANVLGVDAGWLANGEGQMKTKPSRHDSLPGEGDWGGVSSWDSTTPLDDDEVEVPFLSDIELACGDGSCIDEDYNGFKLRFSKSTLRRVGASGDSVICFPVRGNSMEPAIPDGATVAINISDKKIIDGKVFAINQDGWKRLKILYRAGPNRLSIRSFNRAEFPDEEAELDGVEIIGRMFWSASMW